MKENAEVNKKMRDDYTATVGKNLLDFYDVVMQDFIADSETRFEIQIPILCCCGFLQAVDILTEALICFLCSHAYFVMVGWIELMLKGIATFTLRYKMANSLLNCLSLLMNQCVLFPSIVHYSLHLLQCGLLLDTCWLRIWGFIFLKFTINVQPYLRTSTFWSIFDLIDRIFNATQTPDCYLTVIFPLYRRP